MKVLDVNPRDRTDALIDLLKRMTADNAFFQTIQKEHGPEIFTDILRCVYSE
jgi:hypothetical protein